jgi:hypothetical protein
LCADSRDVTNFIEETRRECFVARFDLCRFVCVYSLVSGVDHFFTPDFSRNGIRIFSCARGYAEGRSARPFDDPAPVDEEAFVLVVPEGPLARDMEAPAESLALAPTLVSVTL